MDACGDPTASNSGSIGSDMRTEAQHADQADDLILFEALSQRPTVAWPTVVLLGAAFALFVSSTFAYLQGGLSIFWAILLNTTAAYISFTPAHDASHNAVSTNRQLNEWVGRLATVLQSPVPFFRTFRYIHMQHHRFTNEANKDPDAYLGAGPRWLLPFKWATLDLNYFHYYFKPSVFMDRPKSERKELYLGLLFGAVIVTAVTLAGWLDYYLLLFFIPTRFTAIFLALTFDFFTSLPAPSNCKRRAFSMHIKSRWYGVVVNPGIALSELSPRAPSLPYCAVLSLSQGLECEEALP